MKKGIKLDILRIPTDFGTVVVYTDGFTDKGSKGKVFAELNGFSAFAVGHHRKRTIIRAITQLHQKLSLSQDFSQ
ncbi:hypothetical protein [Jeotgalibacillus campisalis]|uniref:Uncharacterized protein n=1 Tax=Jeotgalibacillus campisalis TaxID=220754 RepID=A0A0C2VSY5_9BACL|nr:hypothetical protein [Jeotgalibacillus campisalis]KIL47531.1 hypothetical protein KR50_16980 [Jeotgalibacillus campisalis]